MSSSTSESDPWTTTTSSSSSSSSRVKRYFFNGGGIVLEEERFKGDGWILDRVVDDHQKQKEKVNTFRNNKQLVCVVFLIEESGIQPLFIQFSWSISGVLSGGLKWENSRAEKRKSC